MEAKGNRPRCFATLVDRTIAEHGIDGHEIREFSKIHHIQIQQ